MDGINKVTMLISGAANWLLCRFSWNAFSMSLSYAKVIFLT